MIHSSSTGSKFPYHIVLRLLLKVLLLLISWGSIISQIYENKFCILEPLKQILNNGKAQSDTTIVTVHYEKILIKYAILVLSCAESILKFYFKTVGTLAVKSAFHTCVHEPKVLSLFVYSAVVTMYNKWCTVYCDGVDTVLCSWKNKLTVI